MLIASRRFNSGRRVARVGGGDAEAAEAGGAWGSGGRRAMLAGGREAGLGGGCCEGGDEAGGGDGETRTRTGDTTIFSRASATGECAPVSRGIASASHVAVSRGFPHFRCNCSPVRHTIANLCPNDSRDAAACLCCCRAIGTTRRPRLSNLAKVDAGAHAQSGDNPTRAGQFLSGTGTGTGLTAATASWTATTHGLVGTKARRRQRAAPASSPISPARGWPLRP
jgi:hypothetical protein